MYKNPQDVIVFMGTTQEQASLTCPAATYTFPFNPDEVKWNLTNNTISRDTVGGRVVQLLSSRIEQMTVSGRAGSRGELQNLALNMKKIMQYQIQSQNFVHFIVPSKKWDFKVYVQNISSLGWDYAATSYPYEIALLVQDDLTGLAKKEIETDALERLAKNIGYSEELHGGNTEEALKISEIYLNSVGIIKSRNQGTASLTSQTPTTATSGSGTGERITAPQGTGNATLTKALLAKADLSTAPQIPSDVRFLTIKQVYDLAYWALNQLGSSSKDIAIIMTAIACVESGAPTLDTQAQAQAVNNIAYGLWQMNEGYGTSLWDPIVSALHMAETYYAVGYDYWGPGPTNKGTYEGWMSAVKAAIV